MALHIGLLLLQELTQLDLTGPYGEFDRLPGEKINLVCKAHSPVRV